MQLLRFMVWFLTHRELQIGQRIRLIFDQLAAGLRNGARWMPPSSKGAGAR
jgi:hypothetical protein